MKLNRLIHFWRFAAAFFVAGAAAWAAPAAKDPLGLQVLVNLPPSSNILLEDRISEQLVDGVTTVLQRQGFAHDVQEYDYKVDAKKVPYLLTINLIEWRIQPGGFIDCTLTANLQTPQGTRSLGTYHDSSFHLGGSGRWSLAREYDEAATGALTQLVRDIVRKDLLPDLAQRAA